MSRTQCALRKAREGDLAELAILAERTFRDSFAADNSPADIDTYVVKSLSFDTIRSEYADPQNTFMLAYDCETNDIVGYTKMRAGSSHERCTAMRPIEIERIYVDKATIGTGVGAMMMQACINYASTASCDELWLGVWEKNRHAIEFYERWEFVGVGNQTFTLGSDAQNDLVMSRSFY